MLNRALALAILDSGEKKKTIAERAAIEPWKLSRILHCGPATPDEQERLAGVLGKTPAELFSLQSESQAVAS